MEDWFTHSDMPESWMLATSPAGFTTDQIAYKWIQYFTHYSGIQGVSTHPIINIYHSLTSILLIGWQLPTPPYG